MYQSLILLLIAQIFTSLVIHFPKCNLSLVDKCSCFNNILRVGSIKYLSLHIDKYLR